MKLKNSQEKVKESPSFTPRVYTLAEMGETGDLALDLSNLASINDPFIQELDFSSQLDGLTEGQTEVSYGLGMPYEENDLYGGSSLRKRLNQW